MGFFSTAAGVTAVAWGLFSASPVAADAPYSTDLEAYQAGAYGWEPNQTFHSAEYTAPLLQINRFYFDELDADAAPYLFTAGGWNGSWGSFIFSSKDLSLVYQDFSYTALAQATQTWQFHGKRVYAALEGAKFRIFNESYGELYAVVPQGDLKGVSPDTHEGVITANNTVLLIACPTATVNLTGHGGPDDAQVANCKIQEIDPKTNDVLFEFAVLDYFNPWDSYIPYSEGSVWDFCHQNSVKKLPNGDYLASYRHLSAVIRINGTTGNVTWVMGGKRNQFKDISDRPGAAWFAYQHDARAWGNTTDTRFTVFDNAQLVNGFCNGTNCSRGLEVEYDVEAMTVKMYNEWYHPQSLLSSSRGGVQKMDNGHVLVAWGENYGWTEYNESGDCVLDIQRGMVGTEGSQDDNNLVVYRTWKDYWFPEPTWSPNISAVADAIHVSWNGLMVSNWLLLLSDSKDDMHTFSKAVAISPRNGFETTFNLSDHNSTTYARVAGLGENGTVLGATPVVDISTGELFKVDYAVKIPNVTVAMEKTNTLSTSAGMSVPTGNGSTEQYPAEGDSDSAAGGFRADGVDMRYKLGFVLLTAFFFL